MRIQTSQDSRRDRTNINYQDDDAEEDEAYFEGAAGDEADVIHEEEAEAEEAEAGRAAALP